MLCYNYRALEFVYYYKTSDGVRHEAEMNAPDRDEVFQTLRRQGIRPIKVVTKGGEDSRQRFVISAWWAIWTAIGFCVIALIFGGWRLWCSYQEREAERTRYRQNTKAAWELLESKALAVEERHNASLKLLDLEVLRDYGKLAKMPDTSALTNGLAQAHDVIESSRTAMRELFGDLYSIFPPESENERRDAQKLYGRIMTLIDMSEERVNSDEIIVGLLLANRGAWSVRDGDLVFSDPRLESEIRYFRKDTDATTTRWQKDFGPKASAIESAPVEVPASMFQKKK